MSLLDRMDEAMARIRLPGLSVATVRDGRIEWAGWGVRETGSRDPVTEETLFQACSISKPVTAVLVLGLVEEGVLDLDDDVNDALVSWRLPPSGGWQPRVTLRHLLTHSGGLTVHGFGGYRHDEPLPTLVQILDGEPPANSPAVRVDLPPGLRWRYSGGGFCIVQQLLEDVTGTPFADLARERLFEPLRMAASSFEQPLPAALAARAATGHGAGGTPLAGSWHLYPELAAAGLWTTPSDLGRLVVELQSRRPRELHEPQLDDWSVGFQILGEGPSLRFGHGGDNQGFKAQLTGYVEHALGMVVMANADSGITLFAELERAVAERDGWPDFELRAAIVTDPDAVAAATGRYKLPGGVVLDLASEADRLLLRVPGQDPLELLPAGRSEWFAEALPLELVVEASRVRVRLDGDELVAARIG